MNAEAMKVLVVDDFEPVRLLLEKCLGELGIRNVSHAEDGTMALHEIQSAHAKGMPFDMVFVDWNMPNKNGHELLIDLRNTPEFHELLFVMVTANSDEAAVIEAIRTGVSDYIVKPFDTRMLSRTIERLVRRFKSAV